jgi:Flp pilus assembly protein TadG
MIRSLRHLARDERGMSFVFVGVGFMAFLAATSLAIDVGMYMVARSQAQNSADSGALAGAIALVFDSWSDRTAYGPVVQNALTAARANQVMSQTVSVTPADVTFPLDPQGLADRVQVTVYRTAARSNPLPTFVGTFFGVPTANMQATATAEASPANAATCVKPWAVPDKWIEHQTDPWDPTDTFDLFDKHGKDLPHPDVYRPITAGVDLYTGYTTDPSGPDYGVEVMLKAGTPGDAIDSSHFYPLALPPNTGGDWYNENIPGCWSGVMSIGDYPPVEPGNMTGPTMHGIDVLIGKDPGAYWDTTHRKVAGSAFAVSPRIVVMPVFDPYVYEMGRQSGRTDIKVANLVGFFLESTSGNSIYGRLVPALGLIRGNDAIPGAAFLKAIRLVQ